VASAVTGLSDGKSRISRRAFLSGGAAAALLAATPVAVLSGLAAPLRDPLVRDRFEPLHGSTLRMTGPGTDINVVLAEISDLRPASRPNDPKRFSLLFRAPHGKPRVSGMRTFQHADLGKVDLFVSPVDRGLEATHFEAIVNRL
jgi:hypothetical protein